MTQQGKSIEKTAAIVEIDGEQAARKAGSESSEKAMQEIRDEMSRLSPEERLKVAKRVEEINAERAEEKGAIPRAKVGYTADGKDVAFIEFDPPTSAKVLEAAALAVGATNPGGGRMRDTVVYQNPTEKKRMEHEALDGRHGSAAAEKVILKKIQEGSVSN
ncbi:MAG: hypothetical protein U0103_23185 [Candidatus Obscuribacterales bacterium]